MDNLRGFFAIVLAAISIILFIQAVGDLRYITTQIHSVQFVIICVVVIGVSGSGAYYLW